MGLVEAAGVHLEAQIRNRVPQGGRKAGLPSLRA